jgi:heterodisulfide reductase subunit B
MKYGFFPGCSYKSEAGYADSVNAINRALGIELTEIQDWNCCGATAMFSLNETNALAITGRLFALATQQGFDEIVTTCNACYTTLRKSKEIFENHPAEINHINRLLSHENLKLSRLLPVRHYLDVLWHDVAKDTWLQKLKISMVNIKVAAYYGCQLTRPWADLDHPEKPTILDQFVERIGFTPIDHSAKTLCCGASHFFPYEQDCRKLITRIIGEVMRKGGQLITTLCPLCQFNLDSAQSNIELPSVPVPYFTQLAGIALGFTPKELGMKKLLIPIEKVFKP